MRSRRSGTLRLTTRFATAAAFAAAVLFLAPAAALAASVSITDFQFTPATVTIQAGDSVTWTNNSGGTPHTTTSDSGVWDSGTLNAGQSFTFTFKTPGTFAYHCDIHPQMTGTVVVEAATTTPPPTPTSTGTGGTGGTGGSTGQPSATVSPLALTGPSAPITTFAVVAISLAVLGVALLLAAARRRGRA